MAEPLDWPLVEDQILDYLTAATGFDWAVHRDDTGSVQPPAGAVRVSYGPDAGGLDRTIEVELTVVAATRSGMWRLTGRTDRAMRDADFLARSYIDQASAVFGWAAEDPGPTGLCSGTATYQLVVRRQPEPTIDEHAAEDGIA